MNQQEQNKIRNYLFRRIDPETLKTIIETNFDFAKREWEPDFEFHNFHYGIATIIVDDLHNYDYIDLNQDLEIYNRLINYFYIVLEKKSRKLFDKLNDDYNNQEEHIIDETLEDKWNTGNKHGNKYDYQHGYCHYFAYNIIGRLKKLYPNKNIRYYLILADEVYDFDEGDIEQSYLIHAYIKIDDLYLDSNGFSTEDEIEQRANDWYERQLNQLPEDYRIDIWHDEYDEIPDMFFNDKFCNTGTIKQDIDKFLSHPEVKELLKIK